MIFLSQLLNVLVLDSRQDVVGKVQDITIFNRGDEYPVISKIVLRRGSQRFFVDYDVIESLGPGEVTLNQHHCHHSWRGADPGEILLYQNVLDQQIFDIKGVRVVRVNDVQFGKIRDRFSLVAIDISNKALLRRLGLLLFPFNVLMKSKYIDWHHLTFVEGAVGSLALKTPYKKLKQLHPADIANLIENLTLSEGSKVVQSFDEKTAAKVLAEVEPEYKDTLLKKIHSKDLAAIFEAMSTDDAADAIQRLSEDKKLKVFKRLGIRKAKILAELTRYREDLAGSLMTADYFAIRESATVKDAIDEIRQKSEQHRSIYHLFAVDNDGHLKGVISIRTLLLKPHRTKIVHVMSPILATVSPSASEDEVARVLTKYNLLSVAVVGEAGRLLGAITVDDVMRRFVPEA